VVTASTMTTAATASTAELPAIAGGKPIKTTPYTKLPRYGEEELARAGAYRVYADPADLLAHLDEVGVRAPGT